MAASRSCVLQIVPTSGSTFEFDVPGVLFSRIARVHNEAGEVTEVAHEWEVDGGLIRTADGTAESTWDRWLAFVALLEARDGNDLIDTVKIVRDPDSANVTEVDLSTGYEQLRIQDVESGGTSELAPAATWHMVVPVSLRITAVKKNADSNGIVDVVQTISSTYVNGLHKLVKETVITTEEGTSAVAKAKAFAAIDIAEWGTSYAYQTNGEDGIAWDELDADDVSIGGPRVPTSVRAVSAIQRYGVEVGTTAPGTSPDSVNYVVTDEIKRDETIRTVSASAEGPGAKAWVLARRPVNSVWREERNDGQANNTYQATWVTRTKRADDSPDQILVEVTGGKRATVWLANSGGLPPVELRGEILPYKATVTLKVSAAGRDLDLDRLRLPGKLPAPWSLSYPESSEALPVLAEKGTDGDGDRWERTAKLVYYSATAPTASPLTQIREAPVVASYFLSGGALGGLVK